MEFYYLQPTNQFLKNLFQFPTGWNSTINSLGVSEYFESFNSQRDGILLFCIFQKAMALKKVSIPNGMEFYSTWLNYLGRFVKSFNSQRDGILPLISRNKSG